MRLVVVVAFAGVVPVADEDAAVSAEVQTQPTEPRFIGEQEVLAVLRHVTRAAPFQKILIEASAVKVAQEEPTTILVRPVVAQVDQGPGVSMSPTGVGVRA